MGSGSFLTGLQGLTEWLGYLILPTLAGLCVCMAIYNFREGRDGERGMMAAIVCLMGPGCALLVSAWTTAAPPVPTDAYSGALMNGVNFVGNVLLPIFAAYNVTIGVLSLGGFLKHFKSQQDVVHYFIVAFGCLTVSGILRLLEHFVLTAQKLSVLDFYIHFSGGLHSCLYV
jgi:hypothetical protein